MTISSFFNRHRAGLRWVPALCCAIIIFTFSAIPGEEIGQSYDRLTSALHTNSATLTAKTLFPALPSFPKLDWLKVGHVIGYFCLGLAVLYALPAASRWSPGIALLLCSLYGVSDEFHQSLIPGRTAFSRDILIDTLAALGGVAVMLGVKAFFNSKRKAAG